MVGQGSVQILHQPHEFAEKDMHSKFKSLFIIFALIVFLLEASVSASNVRRDLTFAFFNLKLSTVGIKKAFGTL